MLRFLIKRRWASVPDGNAAGETFETVDIDVPELERRLFERGGMSQFGYELFDLAGVEQLKPTN